MDWITIEILVLVKAYPSPSTKHGETVCTAGITSKGEWIRIYPVPFRDLDPKKRYSKFQWIKATVKPAKEKLGRRESHRVEADSIESLAKIPYGKGWGEREKVFLPLIKKSMEQIEDEKEGHGRTLAIFKPKNVKSFLIEKEDSEWSAKQKGVLSQKRLFVKDKSVLEKIPYSFSYVFECDDESCNGHKMKIIDWEIGQSYRVYKGIYKTEEEVLQKIKEKWLGYYFGVRETYFVVGTDSEWNKFMILTVISPRRKNPQLKLF